MKLIRSDMMSSVFY